MHIALKTVLRILLLGALTVAVPFMGLPACTKSAEQTKRYHCPMHPTYVSDKPGDCPICGMRLVPIEDKKSEDKKSEDKKPEDEKPAVADEHTKSTAPDPEHGDAGHALWTCPMDPEVVSDKPGRCPKCGMKLEPKAAAEAPSAPSSTAASGPSVNVPGLAAIDVSAEGLRLAGVRTAVAEQGKIARTIRAVGVVRADETRVRHVHTKISGWIEKLYVNFTGEPVAIGRPILSIYSQELLAAQYEYLQARNGASALQKSDLSAVREGADDIIAAARRRLELLDVPQRQIGELERGGTPSRTIVLSAPVGGIVMSKNVFEGQQVDPGTELFTVTDLSKIWLEGDIYESESSAVHVGQVGQITFVNDPASTIKASIKYIYPYLNAETRTLRVRFILPNPGLKLRLESYANVEIPVETDEGAIIPDSAIMDTGVRQVVFVNTEEGHFEPRLVKVGIRTEGKAQILRGVNAGERVAVKANFLLDSESRLRAALMPSTLAAEPTKAGTTGPASSARGAAPTHRGAHP